MPDSSGRSSGARVIPTLRYQNAKAAIEWLERAFGFEPHLVVPGPGDTVAHAQLVADGVMIMLGTARNDDFGALQRPPDGRTCTQSPYIIVDDPDAHYERAVAAGAKVAMDLVDQDYGGRGYSCLDPEGHLWNFGSYDPWAAA